MKKIKVQDHSTGKVRVYVRVKHDIRGIPLAELAREMNLKNELLDYHYEVNNEYQNVDDIEDAADLVNDMLAEYAGTDEDYYDLAEQLLDFVKEDVIAEIFERDDNATEFENDKWDTYNRTTLPKGRY